MSLGGHLHRNKSFAFALISYIFLRINMNSSFFQIFASGLFACALIHTFLAHKFNHLAGRYPEGSVKENIFHLLGEIEVVFGLWSGVFILGLLTMQGSEGMHRYVNSLHFTEPLFVFVMMVIAGTKPVLQLTRNFIERASTLLPFSSSIRFYFSCLVLGPLLGSAITEPAAMTVTALLLKESFFEHKELSTRFKYATLALLFVNISIGGTLTPFAAPPVVMVAKTWGWDLPFMFTHFGWKSIFSILLSTSLITFRFRNEIKNIPPQKNIENSKPLWVSLTHLLFLGLVVVSAHEIVIFMGLFLFFLGFVTVTREYQTELKVREGLLVGFFLAGLVVLGTPQAWWLTPLLARLNENALFFGATTLTAITDNAALTYLGSLVPNLSSQAQYALVSGSVVGGGLTVIANAPNPAGYGILNSSFGEGGISPLSLFLHALIPTGIAVLIFWM